MWPCLSNAGGCTLPQYGHHRLFPAVQFMSPTKVCLPLSGIISQIYLHLTLKQNSDTFDSLWMASCLDGLQPHPLKKHKLANQNTNSRVWVKHKCGINARNAALALCMSTHWPILLAFQKLAVGVDLHIQSQLDIQQFLVLIELLLHAVPHLCHLALLGVHLSTVLVSVAGQHVLQLTNPFLCSCSLNQIQSTLMLSWYNWLVLPSLPLWAWWHVLLS